MRDIDNEITQALSENGEFDPEKADAVRAASVAHYDRAQKKAERHTLASLLLCVVFMAVGAVTMVYAGSTKAIIASALLVLIMFESTILMKLWYWIVQNMLRVLRDVRLLRIDLAGIPGAEGAATAAPTTLETVRINRSRLGKWERVLWYIPILLISMFAGVFVANRIATGVERGTMTSERIIRLEADGHGHMTTRYNLQNTTSRPITERTIYSGGSIDTPKIILPEDSSITDGEGRQLLIRVLPAGPNHKYVIGLARAVEPGERFLLNSESGAEAVREDDVWTFHMSQDWGYGVDHFRDVVVLPPGAKFLSADPEPAQMSQTEEGTVLYWEAERTHGARWEYTVTYRGP
jgi:hypothetical protein